MGFGIHAIAFYFIAARILFQVTAQPTTDAVCTTALWTLNKENVNPCFVAAALQSSCTSGTFNVPALGPNQMYTGPQLGSGDQCKCSTVTYSMISACGACQGQTFDSWTDWATNCSQSQISIQSYPLNIPPNTQVPAWAYLPMSSNGQWDQNAARVAQTAGGVESSASAASPTSTAGGHPNETSSSHPPVAAIAGGVAGGVVATILIGLVIFFLIRRNSRYKRVPPSQAYSQDGLYGDSEKTNPMAMYPQSVSGPIPYYMANEGQIVSQTPGGQPKLYDPADPSTFPTYPASDLVTPSLSGYSGLIQYGNTIPSSLYGSPAPSTVGRPVSRHSFGGQVPEEQQRLYDPTNPLTFPSSDLRVPPPSGQLTPPAYGSSSPSTPYGSQAPPSPHPGQSPSTTYAQSSTLRPQSQQSFENRQSFVGSGSPSAQPVPSSVQGYTGMPEV